MKTSAKKIAVVGGTISLVGIGLIYLMWPFAQGLAGLGSNTYSEGYRDGYVFKVSFKGTAKKVYEIEANPPGGFVVVEKNTAGGAFRANVEDSNIIGLLSTVRGDELVRLHYVERYVRGLDTSTYLITKIERFKE